MSTIEACGLPTSPAADRVASYQRWWHFALIGAWAILCAALLNYDASISHLIHTWADDGTWARRILKLSRYPFTWWGYAAVAIVLAFRVDRKKLLVGFVGATAACMGTVHLLKFILGRARPDLGLGAYHFAIFGNPADGLDSLPSGHTAQAVLLAALVFRYAPRTIWLLGPLAAMAALSRVAQERHFVSDVVTSVGIAILTVQVFVAMMGRDAFPRLWPGRTTSARAARTRQA